LLNPITNKDHDNPRPDVPTQGEHHEIPQEPVSHSQRVGLLWKRLLQGRKLHVQRLRLRPRLLRARHRFNGKRRHFGLLRI
jgi:hypothetical protein